MEGELRNRIDQTPFVGELSGGEFSFDKIINNLSKVIRVETAKELIDRYEEIGDANEIVKIGKKLFDELSSNYGISVPVDFLLGLDKNGDKVVYSVVDKIKGKHFLDLTDSKINTGVVTQIEHLYTTLAKYFIDKYKEGGYYLCDINNQSQYVYGKREGEIEDSIYLVDTDIYMNNNRTTMFLVVEWLARHMIEVEQHLRCNFDEARKYLKEFMDQDLLGSPSQLEKETIKNNIRSIDKLLEGTKLMSVTAELFNSKSREETKQFFIQALEKAGVLVEVANIDEDSRIKIKFFFKRFLDGFEDDRLVERAWVTFDKNGDIVRTRSESGVYNIRNTCLYFIQEFGNNFVSPIALAGKSQEQKSEIKELLRSITEVFDDLSFVKK